MKRYLIKDEFFGSRIYDTIEKKEVFFDKENSEKIKKILEYELINAENNKMNSINLTSPLKISMNITKECNLRCKQCFSDSGEKYDNELSTEEICNLFDEMRKNGTFFISIGGGEPLMRKDLLEILDYGKSKQLAISLVSNGLLLNKSLIKELNDKDLDTLWISFDGLEENHEMLRGKGTFKKALLALQLIEEGFNSKKAIRVSLNKYNIGEYNELIQIAENHDFDIIRFTPLLTFGRAKDIDLAITQEQYLTFLNNIKCVKSKVKIIHPDIVNDSKFWVSPSNFGCHCGKEAIWIDEEGNYSPCIFFGESYSAGNIRYNSYIDLWEKSILLANLDGNEICKSCENYSTCRGGCRARVLEECGNLNEIDPLCPLKRY